MKIMHLYYNRFTSEYTLVDGRDQKADKRFDLGKLEQEDIFRELSSRIDLDRKSELHLNVDFPKDYAEALTDYLAKNSKVKIVRDLK